MRPVNPILIIASILIMSLPLAGQEKRVEITPFFGYTLSEGIDILPLYFPGLNLAVRGADPKSSMSWGFQFDYLASKNFSIGFLLNNQESELIAKTLESGDRKITDLDIRNYHGVITYNAGEENAVLRPFLFGGLGATSYSPGDVMGAATEGFTKFSTTWGGGVKAYLSDNFGIRFMGRWTPTYIKSDLDGYWCNWYGCWILEEADYSNQFEFSLGLGVRF